MAKNKWQYKKKSPEQVKEEIEKLTTGMEESLTNHFHSPGQLKEYLDFMGKFYQYSPKNTALIDSQFSGAEAVGSFSFWKEKGFPVNKGEKGLKVLVPNRLGEQFKNNDDEWKPVQYATQQEKQQVKDGQLEKRAGRLVFSTGTVFDISQTSATQADLPKIFPNKWIDGEVENYGGLRRGMEAIAANNHIKIVEPYEELGAAKGVSYTARNEVALNPRNSERQDTKTLLHELTHAKLHTMDNFHQYTTNEKEFQAEMTAYTVASYFNVDSSDYSLDYLHSWTKDHEFDDHEKLLQEVQGTAKEFIATIEDSLAKEQEGEKDMEAKTPVEGSGKENRIAREEEPVQEQEKLPSEQLRDMYRRQIRFAAENDSPFPVAMEKEEESNERNQHFKDAYKKEIMNVIEPAVGKELDKKEGNDRMERLQQMRDFEKNHSKETVYELKKTSLQELRELPLTERGQQRLSQIESKLDKEYSVEKEQTNEKSSKKSLSKQSEEKTNDQTETPSQPKRKQQEVEMER